MPQVKRIFMVSKKQFFRTRSRALIGAEKVWSEVKDPSGRVVDGSGVLVSVSDTGLDYTHSDFLFGKYFQKSSKKSMEK